MRSQLKRAFPFLRNANEKIWQEIEEFAIPKKFRKGEFFALEGDTCHYFPMILSGSIRVYKGGDTGKEITLYRIQAGECCILSAFCIMSQTPFSANAYVDEDVSAILIPAPVFRDWIHRHEIWRNFVFKVLFRFINEIIWKIESLAFQRVDERIASFLVNEFLREHKSVIQTTHSDIARELGTAREVVSRVLKGFEREKLIQLARGKIIILNHWDLRRHSHSRMLQLAN